MNKRIQDLLERELGKLEYLSTSSLQPLLPHDIKSLDTLIKAYRSFVDPADRKPATPAPTTPETAPTSDLLNLSDPPASEDTE